jgi:hypothetical protein
MKQVKSSIHVLNLPCFSGYGTKIFTSTADQRFLANGSDDFLRTHFPITVQSHHLGHTVTLTEQEVLAQLLKNDTVIGNRVMILYGAAGSGKSELLRWLQTQVQGSTPARSELMTRISRTDLDIFRIVQRLQRLLPDPVWHETTRARWEECRQKPRTLAKILVLTTLEQLLHSDDHINALYYHLVDVVHTNLERWFTVMNQPPEHIEQFIELFSREDVVTLQQESIIPLPLDYETLRFTMLKVLRDQLLEGLNLADVFSRVASYVQDEYHQRPILLIDDLVQSINIFATDLLDYFLTLEEGCWDVIIGITPNSLGSTLRGKELLERIQYLDTIDDRVHKLWLSDEWGQSSSFLTEESCIDYARLYLSEYKRLNHVHCNASCGSFQYCSLLEPGRSEELLAPFNKEALIRLFRSLPPGKGKVRYFTLYLKEILERTSTGEDILDTLAFYTNSEQAVYHPDARVTKVLEFYGPIAGKKVMNETNDASPLYQFFAIPQREYSLEPVIAPLFKQQMEEHNPHPADASHHEMDSGKIAIRAWLQKDGTNKQLLKNMRRGAVKTIKDGYVVDCMTRLYTAKPFRVLRWAQTHFDTIPPLHIEDIDDFDGIYLSRNIGPLAYLFHDFADAVGQVEQNMKERIITDTALPNMMYQAMSYRRKNQRLLEEHLGVPIEYLSYALLILARALGQRVVDLPVSVEQQIGFDLSLPQKYPESLESARPRLTSVQVNGIHHLFDDCFKLRDNIYDGLLLERMGLQIDPEQALIYLQQLDPHRIPQDFHFNEQPLSLFITEIQNIVTVLIHLKSNTQVTNVLCSLCNEKDDDELSRKFISPFNLVDNIQEAVEHFIQRCSVFELHSILTLAYAIDTHRYKRSKEELHLALAQIEEETQTRNRKDSIASSQKGFTRRELAILIKFSQQDYRIALGELNSALLAKVAQHFPGLYKKLELRLQRG